MGSMILNLTASVPRATAEPIDLRVNVTPVDGNQPMDLRVQRAASDPVAYPPPLCLSAPASSSIFGPGKPRTARTPRRVAPSDGIYLGKPIKEGGREPEPANTICPPWSLQFIQEQASLVGSTEQSPSRQDLVRYNPVQSVPVHRRERKVLGIKRRFG